ncbi:MAG: TonB-dependent receptor [Prevotella sp.]|nr:TonB-dependent receptor [Prevotella sp.]
MKKTVLSLWLLMQAVCVAQAQTVRQQMDSLADKHHVSFVYDSRLPLDAPAAQPLDGDLPLEEALRQLFARTNIIYKVEGKHVLLKLDGPESEKTKNCTVSGHVRDAQGELLINATVYDLTSRQGTMTNAYGYYSLTLPAGVHQLRVTYLGCEQQTASLSLTRNQSLDFRLHTSHQLDEVIITGDLNSPVAGTQMGKRSLRQGDIKTEFSLLSSPDVVKTLQRMSGVQEGIELASGLYVHGGNADENLFLLDGTPLYSVNHSLGLFSSFNTDVVKNVDFYKSGFPARYGGRLSSVVDVRTNDGNWQQLHGSYRIGLLDGSLQLDGPVKWKGDRRRESRGEVRGQDFGTSFNVGLRRSWLDLMTRPIFAIINNNSGNEDKVTVNYAFHDLNAKLTHIFSRRSVLSLSLYSGLDALTAEDDYSVDSYNGTHYQQLTESRLSWGNFNAALDWRYQLSPQLQASFTAVYTHNRALMDLKDDDRSMDVGGKITSSTLIHHSYRSTINDLGYRSEFDYRPSPRHHIRFGHDYTCHLFRPQTNNKLYLWSEHEETDTMSTHSRNRHSAHELTLYGEDQLTLNDSWSLNGGVNLSLFAIGSKTFVSADPRLAVKYQLLPQLSLKASYTLMTQYVHKISNAFLDLPSDYWVPTTQRLRPMHSHQLAAGVYWQPARQWLLMVEGYYKLSRHLLQYATWSGLEPPAARWDTQVMDGQGRFYGVEADVQYHTKRLQATLAYTLSWNERRFDEFYTDWYYDKFDNRHKLNLSLRYNFGPKTQMYAAWTCHTGNRMTFPSQYVQLPDVPDGHTQRYVPSYYPYDGADAYESGTRFIYEHPNNITLPAYHRLDVGFNFCHTTKHGHERIWNLSIYNAYCHLNTLWNTISYQTPAGNKVNLVGQEAFRVNTHGYIPIIPSFSYTIKF